MSRHRPRRGASSMFPAAAMGGIAAVMAALVIGVTIYGARDGAPGSLNLEPSRCAATVRVVTAASFAPVLEAVAPALATGANCLRAEVIVVDGRAAAERVGDTDADVWIPDDAAWAGMADTTKLAPKNTLASGAVLATSPIFMVTDPATADRIQQAGASWLALADLVTGDSGVRLTVRDPAGSADGMLAAGAVGEGVWLARGMDASSLALTRTLPATRTVTGDDPALPGKAGEVGLVPEYALLPAMPADAVALPGTDRTALLRYTWLPTAAAAADAGRVTLLTTLLDRLRGPAAEAAMAAAKLRGPEAEPHPGGGADRLPTLVAKPFDVLGPHHVDHVFATWYAEDRRTNLLMVIDVSGSMAEPGAGADRPVIETVKQGCEAVATLLPDDARLALWEFGAELEPPNDYRSVLGAEPLSAEHRRAWTAAVGSLAARRTGTGLYDTILAAFENARDSYLPGAPNQVFVFTDGRNEDDPDSINAQQLADGLARAKDPSRPVQLSLVAYGQKEDADALKEALKPVDGYVDAPETAAEVGAVFIHVAAGGLHGD